MICKRNFRLSLVRNSNISRGCTSCRPGALSEALALVKCLVRALMRRSLAPVIAARLDKAGATVLSFRRARSALRSMHESPLTAPPGQWG